MDRIGRESRYLLLLVSAIMQQQKSPALAKNQISWGNVYRIADSNRIANLVYFGILGLGSEIDKRERQLFFDRYQQELKSVSVYESEEALLLQHLEKNHIHAVVLESSRLRKLYPHREMGKMDCIRILVPKGKRERIAELMHSLEYEVRENREDEGTLYYKIPGVNVSFYENLDFANRKLESFFNIPVKSFSRRKGYHYIRSFVGEEAYLYLLGMLARQYALAKTDIRAILDFWLFEKKYEEELNWPYIEKVIEKAGLAEFWERITELASIWFEQEVSDEVDIYNAMEVYIFSRGEEGRAMNARILPLDRDKVDFYQRDRKREWLHRKREWLFPNREYMHALYPILDKRPWLIGGCRLLRLWRTGILSGIKIQQEEDAEEDRKG